MTQEELQTLFILDRDATARTAWLVSSSDARCFMNNDYSPLERDGLIKRNDPNNPVVEKSSIPERVRFLHGRIFSNEYEPEIVPFEGESLDEPYRMVAKSLFLHERADVRDEDAWNLDEEMDQSVLNALVDGMGYIYETIDETLRDELFYLGKAVYYSPDPRDVVLDYRAKRVGKIRHFHLIKRYTEEEFSGLYPRIDVGKVTSDWRDHDNVANEDLIPVFETQYKKRSLVKKIALTPKQRKEFDWPDQLAEIKEFRRYLKDLKLENPEKFEYVDVEAIIADAPVLETKDWGVYSMTWAGGLDKSLEKETYIGQEFSLKILSLIDVFDTPYAFGVPHFLRSLQALEIISRTIQARLTLRMDNPGGFYDEAAIQPTELEEIKKNIIGQWYKLNLFGGKIDDHLKTRDITPHLQFLSIFLGDIKDSMDSAFGTWREQMGQAAFAGQSGKMAQTLLASGAYIFTRFVRKIELFLKQVYAGVLMRSAAVIPPRTLIIIAGEQFPERQKVITDESFYQRIQRVNVKVQLDTSTEGDKQMQKGIVAQLLLNGTMAPISGFRELEFKEPAKLAQEIDAWIIRHSRAEYIAKREQESPALAGAIDATIKEYDTVYQKGGNTS